MATTDQWQNQLGALSFHCVVFLNAPQEGEILIDGVNLNAYDQNSLKRRMSLVSQEPLLFAQTIRENIGMGLSVEDGLPDSQAPSF